jgi:hypothetical protein
MSLISKAFKPHGILARDNFTGRRLSCMFTGSMRVFVLVLALHGIYG